MLTRNDWLQLTNAFACLLAGWLWGFGHGLRGLVVLILGWGLIVLGVLIADLSRGEVIKNGN